MAVSKSQILEQLKRIKGPDLEGNIVDLGLVSEILLRDDKVYFSITVPPDKAAALEPLRQAAEKVVKDIPGVQGVTAVLTAEAARGGNAGAAPPRADSSRVQQVRAQQSAAREAAARPQPAPGGRPSAGVPGIKHMIAVASGKGGVGKSTTAVNLALGFQAIGLKAGILDADIYGPSQPRLLGLSGRPQVIEGSNRLKPMEGFGLKAMSMGFMVDEGTPIIWRGPMVVSALTQMLREVEWGELDVLVIDMPPGTGDVQLTMAQQVPLSGAIIVSTPQDLALIDARKGLAMFRKTDIPVLGIIENMSYFLCPSCGERSDIFGHGGAAEEARRLGIPFLGEVPLHMSIRARSDEGRPIVAAEPESQHAQIFRDLAAKAWDELSGAAGQRVPPPSLKVKPGADALDVSFQDGGRYELSAEMLRVMSPSAEVQGHSPEQRVTVGKKRNVKIRDLVPVGNYAVKIVFDDGHDTGLYTWPYLALLGREKDKRWAQYLKELEAKRLDRG
ncbi:MAG: ATPase [Hyphomicrobium sp. SCN 65-11]|nr:MAG: ATPase [Hyphomicrobium sp. SCN 65-11]